MNQLKQAQSAETSQQPGARLKTLWWQLLVLRKQVRALRWINFMLQNGWLQRLWLRWKCRHLDTNPQEMYLAYCYWTLTKLSRASSAALRNISQAVNLGTVEYLDQVDGTNLIEWRCNECGQVWMAGLLGPCSKCHPQMLAALQAVEKLPEFQHDFSELPN